MDAGIVMDTKFVDGRQNAGGGFLGKLLSADKRRGDLRVTAAQKQLVAFAARCTDTIWLQGLPFSRLVSRALAAAQQRGGSREAGSLLGGIVGGGDSDDEK